MDTLNWETININEIFDISYGNKLDMCQMTIKDGGIPFITRSASNNGIGGYVELINGKSTYPANCLTIALGGSIGSTFLQIEPFYTSQNVAVLQPLEKISNKVLLFIATIIEKECNKKYVAFGRELNKHIRTDFTIKLPLLDDKSPDWVKIENEMEEILLKLPERSSQVLNKKYDTLPETPNSINLSERKWKEFRFDRIFMICKGFYNKKPDNHSGNSVPFIGAIDNNNGISEYYDIKDIEEASKTGDENNVPLPEKIFEGNCITVSNNGSVGYAFYQQKSFTCSHDVNPLYLHPDWNKELNPYIAMFLCSLIEKERYRWTYGRKWRPKRMPSSIIKLPVDSNENPDWQFMEDYIKSLPYSKNL